MIFCFGLEIYLRISGNYKLKNFIVGNCGWNRNLESGIPEDLILSDNAGLGWELSPRARIINGYGRFKKGRQKKPKGVFRILILGDSVTQMGNWKVLEEKLNTSGLNYRFEVWNCGVSGYGISNFYYYLKERALNFDADLIIIGFCLTTFSGSNLVIFDGKKYLEFFNPFMVIKFPFNRILFLHSHLYRFIVYDLEKIVLNKIDLEKIIIDRFKWLVSLCHKNEIEIIAIIWPFLKNNYSDNDKYNYFEIRSLVEMNNIPYIDCHKSLVDRDDSSLRMSPDDYIHPSEKAFEIMAPDIYNFIVSYLKAQRILK